MLPQANETNEWNAVDRNNVQDCLQFKYLIK